MNSQYRYGIYAGVGLWILGLVVKSMFSGVLTALVNPFTWWLSFMEAVELAVWLTGPTADVGFFLEGVAAGNPEARYAVVGWIGILAWSVSTISIYLHGRQTAYRGATVNVFLSFLFVPIIALVGAARSLRADA